MEWSKVAIEDLKKYGQIKASISHLEKRILDLKEIEEAAMNYAKTADGDVKEAADALTDAAVERARLEMLVCVNKKLVWKIEDGLNKLNAHEKKILTEFYTDRKQGHVRRISDSLKYEKSEIYRQKDEALYKFVCGMYGILDY
ncbi:MAG: hypothetical protein LBP62_08070 [Clostridiales bacterium]|jgi:hypothetical protein|nr:hypothetical protein [Clostridiales bacterium]